MRSQVAFRGVTGDRRGGLSAQDAVSWATSWLPVVADGSGWPAMVPALPEGEAGSPVTTASWASRVRGAAARE